MTIYPSISRYIGVLSLIVFFASASLAQVSGLRRSDSLRMDSLKQILRQRYLMKTDSMVKDTSNHTFKQSRLFSMYVSPGNSAAGSKNLLVQAVRFGHGYYLNVLLKTTLARPVTVSLNDQLHLTFDDNSATTLSDIGAAASHSNGMRNGSDLQVEYTLLPTDSVTLSNKKITAIAIDYDGGSYAFTISGEASSNIQKALAAIK